MRVSVTCLARLSAALCAAAFALVLSTALAIAHAQLISSAPADGALLPIAPDQLTLTFSEPARPLVARLIHPDGRTEILKDIGEKGSVITLTLPPELANGTYVLSWRVASSDGHPVGGGLVFSIGAPSAAAPPAVEQAEPSVRIGLWAARLLLMLGLIVGVGGVTFNALIVRSQSVAGGTAVTTLVAGVLAAPLLIGFQGLDALGAPLSGLIEFEVWKAGLWATSYGRSVLLAVIAILLAYAAIQAGSRQRFGIPLAAAALVVTGVSFAAAGHASTAPPRYLTVPAVFFHGVAVLLWIGALLPLGRALLQGGPSALLVLKRFSSAIPAIVTVLIGSGLVLAMVQVETLPALWNTGYGQVLLAKLALVAAILSLAAFNRYRLSTPAMTGEKGPTRHLVRSIVAEIVLATLVIGVLGLWRFTPPPRAMNANPAQYASQEISVAKEGVTARLSIRPPIAGPVRIELRDLMLDGKPLDPISVSIELDKPSYGIGPFAREARKLGDGAFIADGFVLPLDGFWIVRMTVVVSDFRSVTLMDVFDVQKAS